uniref:CBS domain-containing protein n=1 Tax=Arcella intermedia TaxID=1963864 RepID=A0A6B2LBH4_9EUKA
MMDNETVDVLPAPQKLITFTDEEDLYSCFKQLIENHILSAPVWDSKKKEYSGFLDVRDLVPIILKLYDQKQEVSDLNSFLDAALMKDKFSELGSTPLELSKKNAFKPIKKSDPLRTIVHLLSSTQLRRVPVLDDEGNLINIVAQSSLIKYFGERCIKIPEDNSKEPRIADLPLGSAPVATVSKNETVVTTFRKLAEEGRSGLAMLDDHDGRLVGTTTAKDLGLFLRNPNFALLEIPIFQHLQKIRAEQFMVVTPCISVFPSDAVSRVVGLLMATKVHRIFVVDNEVNFKPIRVISIQDILKYFDQVKI